MNTKIINVGNTITLRVTASNETFEDIKNRFPNENNSCEKYEYDIYYNETDVIEKLELGKEMLPFRNATYIVNNFNNTVVAYSPKQQYSCENLIIRDNNVIKIFYKNDLGSKILIRVITELLIRKLLEKGYFPIHASCVMINNEATLFIGKKNSGKSTALFSNVLFNNAYPISNDITFVGKHKNDWKAVGIPYDITFDASLFNQVKQINEEMFNVNNEKLYDSDKVRFNISEFTKFFKTKWFWEASISIINIVELDKENDFVMLPIVSSAEAVLYLQTYGKDKNFNFDDFMMINNLYPKFNYDELSEEISFNKLKGNILKHYIKR